jgi:hypothetical protein
MCSVSVHTPKCDCLYPCIEQRRPCALLSCHTPHSFVLLDCTSQIKQECWYIYQARCCRYKVNFVWLMLTSFVNGGWVFCTWLKTSFVLGCTEFFMFPFRKRWHCIIVLAHERWKVWKCYETCVWSSEWNVTDSAAVTKAGVPGMTVRRHTGKIKLFLCLNLHILKKGLCSHINCRVQVT